MRVGLSLLTFSPGDHGGSETYARQLLRSLGRVGTLDYVVLVPARAKDAAEGLPAIEVKDPPVAKRGPLRIAAMALQARRTKGVGDQVARFDVMHYPLTVPSPGSDAPTVVTLHDVQHRDLPEFFGPARRSFRRLAYDRAARSATAVIVTSEFVRARARDALDLDPSRIHVVPLAPRPAFQGRPGRSAPSAAEWRRLGISERYLVYTGRHDARHDAATLLRALAMLGTWARPDELPTDAPWPPRVLIVDASPEDRAAIARSAARENVGDLLDYAPRLPLERLAGLVRDARSVVVPAASDAAGLAAIESIGTGTPVVASSVGALPDVVGTAGILVEPGEPRRLASALATVWADDAVRDRLAAAARERAISQPVWRDVALATRRIYADVAIAASD